MILTRWFSFAAPPKCGCLWFREILRISNIGVFGKTIELQMYRDSVRHHVPGRLPSITIVRNPEKWLKSYLFHFKGKKMAIPAVDQLIGREIDEGDVEAMYKAYDSTFTINLEREPALRVIEIFRHLSLPHDPEKIMSLEPQNVTDFDD